ncbi:MAG: helix-turn-helix transcriptional regulator [Bryobacteraceae bacterium]|jgi:cytoskeletal protein RodZ
MTDDNSVLGLATVRRNRGISLQQISDSTKIGIRALEAIEQGDFRKLPGGIYATSYIRQYARAIDYDESVILALYFRQAAPGESGSSRAADGKSTYRTWANASTVTDS